ncbi:MAG: ABC transporter transmembrane domain-containing protein, partial [Nanoarchaeota archaeon]
MKKKKDIDYKYNLKIYLEILKNYKPLFILLLLIILIVQATDVVDKFLFKIIIDKGTDFLAEKLSSNLFLRSLVIVAVIFCASLLLKAAGRWMENNLITKLEVNLIQDLKKKFFNHLLHLSHGFHTSHKTGSLISRLIRGGSAIERLTDDIIFSFAPLIFQLIILSASLIYLNLNSAIIIMLTGIAFIFYSLAIQNVQKTYNINANLAEDIEKANISDIFTNIDSIKYFGKEKIIKEKFSNLTEATKKAFIKYWGYYKWLNSGQTLILGIGTFFLIYFPLVKFLNHGLTLGTLTFIYSAYISIVGSLFGLVHGIRDYYRSMGDFDALFKYGKIENE